MEFLGKWALRYKGKYVVAYETYDTYWTATEIADLETFIGYRVAPPDILGDKPARAIVQSQTALKYLAPGTDWGAVDAFAANASLESAFQFSFSLIKGVPHLFDNVLTVGAVIPPGSTIYFFGFTESGNLNKADMAFEIVYVTPSMLEIIAALGGPGIDLRNVVLGGGGFNGYDFQGTNFSHGDLSFCDFSGSRMQGANCTGAYIEQTKFTAGCNLTGADFTGATGGADFSGCDLTNAIFTDVDLSSCQFSPQTILRGAKLTGANLSTRNMTGVDFSDAQMQQTVLNGTDFSSAKLAGTDLSNTDLGTVISSSQAICSTDPANRTKFINSHLNFSLLGKNWYCLDLTDAIISQLPRDSSGRVKLDHLAAHDSMLTRLQLPGAILQYARFDNSFLTGANLTEADLSNASLTSAWLEGDTSSGGGTAQLSGTTLYNANLSSAHLSGVDFSGAYLYGQSASVAGATMKLVKFPLAYLPNMDFSNVDLTGADFAYACLVNAKFVGAVLSEYQTTDLKAPVSLYKACLQGADFSQSTLNGADLNDAAVATTPGSIQVTIMLGGEPVTMTQNYPNPTTLPQSTTNSSTVCPNGSRGPCAASQLISDEAPAEWPPREVLRESAQTNSQPT
jgi:uncharacterized protein YjbI with pentapeptide repeats